MLLLFGNWLLNFICDLLFEFWKFNFAGYLISAHTNLDFIFSNVRGAEPSK
jgi:hypothetical protein